MRRMFNEGGYVDRAKNGELREKITHSGTPSQEIGLPPGTVSQMVSYLDENGEELARAHRFVLPDGSIGASGKPDPKRLLKDGKLYRIEKSK